MEVHLKLYQIKKSRQRKFPNQLHIDITSHRVTIDQLQMENQHEFVKLFVKHWFYCRVQQH
jgi:hypothetical protein